MVLLNEASKQSDAQPHGLEINVSDLYATGSRSRLGISSSPTKDIAQIILHCLVCSLHTEYVVVLEIHFLLVDQLFTSL